MKHSQVCKESSNVQAINCKLIYYASFLIGLTREGYNGDNYDALNFSPLDSN